jgi:hypothetical protein
MKPKKVILLPLPSSLTKRGNVGPPVVKDHHKREARAAGGAIRSISKISMSHGHYHGVLAAVECAG